MSQLAIASNIPSNTIVLAQSVTVKSVIASNGYNVVNYKEYGPYYMVIFYNNKNLIGKLFLLKT